MDKMDKIGIIVKKIIDDAASLDMQYNATSDKDIKDIIIKWDKKKSDVLNQIKKILID